MKNEATDTLLFLYNFWPIDADRHCVIYHKMVLLALSICCWSSWYNVILYDSALSRPRTPATSPSSNQCHGRHFADCLLYIYVSRKNGLGRVSADCSPVVPLHLLRQPKQGEMICIMCAREAKTNLKFKLNKHIFLIFSVLKQTPHVKSIF